MRHDSFMPPLLEICDLHIVLCNQGVDGVNLRIGEGSPSQITPYRRNLLAAVLSLRTDRSRPPAMVVQARANLFEAADLYSRQRDERSESRLQTMMRLARRGATALLLLTSLCMAQTTAHKKAPPPPKPEPTEPELVEYIRGQLLSLSPSDGINDNLDVRYDETNKVLTLTTPAGHCDIFLSGLNPNNAVWDVFDPSDSDRQREKLVRLTMVSVSGKTARICYDKLDHVDTTLIGNRARLLFSEPKADDVPDFHEKMAKAMKKLIVLVGGAPEKDIF